LEAEKENRRPTLKCIGKISHKAEDDWNWLGNISSGRLWY
jgi:hypothetical protein